MLQLKLTEGLQDFKEDNLILFSNKNMIKAKIETWMNVLRIDIYSFALRVFVMSKICESANQTLKPKN